MTTYPVQLDDLMLIADAAAELNATTAFFVDQPSEQQRIQAMARRLHDIVQRSAGAHDTTSAN